MWRNYIAWFSHEGMRTLWWHGSTVSGNHDTSSSLSVVIVHQIFTDRSESVQRKVNIIYHLLLFYFLYFANTIIYYYYRSFII
jgi:hypothetical protein